jgi:hypothetical protein
MLRCGGGRCGGEGGGGRPGRDVGGKQHSGISLAKIVEQLHSVTIILCIKLKFYYVFYLDAFHLLDFAVKCHEHYAGPHAGKRLENKFDLRLGQALWGVGGK